MSNNSAIDSRYKRIAATVGKMPKSAAEAYDVFRAVKAHRSPEAALDAEVRRSVDVIKPDGVGDLIVGTSERLARLAEWSKTVEYVESEAALRVERELGAHGDLFLAAIAKRFNPLAEEYHAQFDRLPVWALGDGDGNVDRRESELARKLVAADPEVLATYKVVCALGGKLRELVADAAVVIGSDPRDYPEWLALQVGNWSSADAARFAAWSRFAIRFEALDVKWLYPDAWTPPVGVTGFLVYSGARFSMPETVAEFYRRAETMHPDTGSWHELANDGE